MAIVAGLKFPDNLACLTCCHVLDGSPIRLVCRDGENDWQFLCERDAHEGSDARIISLAEVLEIEPRLSALSPLGPGEQKVLA